MTKQFKCDLEKLTDSIMEIRKKTVEHYPIIDSENVKKFESMITGYIIPLIFDSSVVLGRSGCSLNYYSNELAIIRDPKKRIFIQILFYPYGHSKITLGVNAPFLQFSYSPTKENIKITTKISLKSDEGSVKINEIDINDFTTERIDKYIFDFFVNTVKYNSLFLKFDV